MPDGTQLRIETVSPAEVQTWLEAGDVVLVDVREVAEYEAEHIAGALLLPLSSLDPDLFPALSGQRVVLHCAIGKRSEAAAKMLIVAGHGHIVHMDGGLKAWKEAGLDTELPLDEPDEPAHAPAPHPGYVLAHDYLGPQSLGTEALAQGIGVVQERIERLVDGEAAVDPELSLRLARFFSTEPDFWMQLQLAHDLDRTRIALDARIAQEIRPKAA